MIINHSEYNADNKVFCRYYNRDISVYGDKLSNIEAALRAFGHNISLFEEVDLTSPLLNSLDIKEIREFECDGTPAFRLIKMERFE